MPNGLSMQPGVLWSFGDGPRTDRCVLIDTVVQFAPPSRPAFLPFLRPVEQSPRLFCFLQVITGPPTEEALHSRAIIGTRLVSQGLEVSEQAASLFTARS